MTIIGIDPGLDGALFVLAPSPEVHPMPVRKVGESAREVDCYRLSELLADLDLRYGPGVSIFLERISGPVPRTSLQSAFKFGKTYQSVIAALEIGRYAYDLVDARKWKAVVLRGTDHSKQAAVEWANRQFPTLNIGNHDGKADACCIAEYGRRLTMGVD